MNDFDASRAGPSAGEADTASFGLLDLALPLAQHWGKLIVVPIVAGALAFGATYLRAPTFTAKTTLLPPQSQGSASALIGSLGNLASLAGAGGGLRTPGDQYVSMLSSQTIADKLLDQFDLIRIYEAEFRFQARQRLAGSTRIALDKKDGLISIEVDDESPQRAADIANAYVDRLRDLTSTLAITEAQQRREFFERELSTARKSLLAAQSELQRSGVSESALRAEPRAVAEALSTVRAELAATEIQLRIARRTLSDEAVEVQQLLTKVTALRDQQARLEQQQPRDESNYIGKYREFKYQEGLVEAFSRQYELARLDEQREGALIQVIDRATLPEWKSSPKRGRTAVAAAVAAVFLMAGFLIGRQLWRLSARSPHTAAKLAALKAALRRRHAT